jgi:hydroxymethylglutaryl-CoA lyase
MRKLIKLSDVSARDGLQSLKKVLTLSQKIDLVIDLTKCKFDEVEIGSLVNYKVIPTMKNSLELYNHFKGNVELEKYYLLIGNEKSINTVNDNSVKNISFFTSPSNTFNKKNINLNTEDSFNRISKMINMLDRREDTHIKGYLSCIGSCPFEGDVNIDDIVKSVKMFKKIGVDEICLADTIGDLKKEKLESILEQITSKTNISTDLLSIHLHTQFADNYWKENIRTALKYDIMKYDTSILNIGGCPAIYKKNKSDKLNGNLNVINAYNFFEDEGYYLNVDKKMLEEVEKKWKNILF